MKHELGKRIPVIRTLHSHLPNVALAVLVCVGCGPKEMTWERDGIQYTKRTDDTAVTMDVLEEMIRHRDVIGAYLHLQPPGGSILRYRKFLDRDDIAKRSHCSKISAGCYFDQFGVESKQPLDAHELIHAYTGYLGAKPKIVEEGLAQALSCEHPTVGSADLAVENAWSKSAWESPRYRDIDALYRAGAAFVAYVIQVHGAGRFMEFYAKLSAEDELVAVAAKFAESFGQSMAEVWSAALANRESDRACVYPLRCAEPPVSTEFTTYRADGRTLLHVTPAQRGSKEWYFGSCDTTPMVDADFDRSSSGAVRAGGLALALGEGRYWLASESATRSTQPLREVLGREYECAALQPLAITDTSRLFAVSRDSLATLVNREQPPAPNGSWILRGKLDNSDGRVRVECSPNVRVEICETCDYTGCRAVCETGHTSVANGNSVANDGAPVLRVHLHGDAGFWVRLRREKHPATGL